LWSHSAPAPGDGILEIVAEARRYQLQKDAANQLIADLLDVEEVPAERATRVRQAGRVSRRVKTLAGFHISA